MTNKELIARLKRLDTTMTKGGWAAWQKSNEGWALPGWSFGNPDVSPDDLSEHDATGIAFLRNSIDDIVARLEQAGESDELPRGR